MRPNLHPRQPIAVIALSLILAVLSLAGCSLLPGQGGAAPKPTTTRQTAAVFPTPTAEPSPTAQPTATPEPTPIVAAVAVSDQTIGEDGVLTVDRASLPDGGWLAVFSQVAGERGDLLGYVDLPAGAHENVRVTIDPFQASSTLIVELHSNAGDLQEFELPEPDVILPDVPPAEFAAEVILPQASIEVADQEISYDGIVNVAVVDLLEPTWVAIHADEDGSAGPVLGQVLLEPGEHTDVPIPIAWQKGTPQLYAVLHEDTGEPGYLDYPAADLPLLANGEAIATTFAATYPPNALVYDQPVLGGEVVIDRVISNGPGWVAVQYDDNGQPGLIIGESPLVDGLNEQVAVKLIQSAITPILFVRIHADTTADDPFNFPAADPIVTFAGRIPQAQSFSTTAGSYLITHDQALDENGAVSAAVVVATSGAWLVVQADDNGTPGEVIGQTFVPAGISRDVAVDLDPAPAPGTLYMALYQDAGELEVFEAPDGPDTLFRVQGGMVEVPFQLLEPAN